MGTPSAVVPKALCTLVRPAAWAERVAIIKDSPRLLRVNVRNIISTFSFLFLTEQVFEKRSFQAGGSGFIG
jgi:hypothetical protein